MEGDLNMALKLVRPGPVVVSGTKGSYSVAGGSAPPGWTVWGSDGRIIPPPGLYRVTTTGMTVRKRTTDGNFVAVGDLVRINAGEAITPDYKTSEDVVMVEKVIPPPYFVGLLRAWWGACHGAKTNRSTLYPQGVHRARADRECQYDRLGKFLPGAFAGASQDYRRGNGKRFGTRRNVNLRRGTVRVAGAQRARLNGGGGDRSKGAGALSECVAQRARRCAGSGGALSRTLTAAGVAA